MIYVYLATTSYIYKLIYDSEVLDNMQNTRHITQVCHNGLCRPTYCMNISCLTTCITSPQNPTMNCYIIPQENMFHSLHGHPAQRRWVTHLMAFGSCFLGNCFQHWAHSLHLHRYSGSFVTAENIQSFTLFTWTGWDM